MSLLIKTQMTIAVQINGKLRHTFELPAGTAEAEVLAAARAEAPVAKWLDTGTLKKHIYVPGKLLNFIVA
jgi:leucyl-tRNA synthetase